MLDKDFVIKVKTALKGWIYSSALLKGFFILLYKLNQCRPWSMGYSFYKFTYIKNVVEKELHYFRENALPRGYGEGLDERVVEYPWVFSRIGQGDQVILDAGSTLNHWDILSLSCLQDKKLYLVNIFYEGQYGDRKNVIYRYEDIRSLSFPDDYFDAVLCISTLEHVGMDNTCYYGTDERKRENIPSAYLQAVRELKRVLKKGGALYLTVPYGAYKNHRWFQIFDAEMVGRLKKEFLPARILETYFKYEAKQWNFSNASSCRQASYFDVRENQTPSENYLAAAQSVACLEMVK